MCVPSTFDFGLPADFMIDDQEAQDLAALSEDIFSSSDFILPDFEPSLPIRSAASSCCGEETPFSMVPLETLHLPLQQTKLEDSVAAPPSPSSSGTSYRPAFDAEVSYGSDCTEAAHSDTLRLTSRKTTGGVKVDIRIGKRKPDVDLDSITDIHERRKQRRLAKNRATAATSRARKREQMSHLSVRVAELEEQNAALTEALAACNRKLVAATTAVRPL